MIPETNLENIEQQSLDSNDTQDIQEIVIGIPSDAALIKMSILRIGRDGKPEELAGKFDLENIVIARMKYLQLLEKAGVDGTNADTKSNGAIREEKLETEKQPKEEKKD